LAVGLLVIFGSFLIMLEWILIRHTMELAAQISIGDSKQRVDSLLGVPHSARTIRGMTSHRWKVSRLNLLAKPIFIQIRFAEEGRVNSIQTEKQTKTWRTPERISAGHIVDYASTGVYDLSDREIYIVHGEQNRLFAMSASCSHLHCTVFWLEGKDGVDETFKDPCHGCIFDSEGVNIAGAAPRPLERFKISRVGDRIVVDKTVEFRGELDEWDDPDSFLIFEP
jgi:Rieske Fe-S protein